MQAGGSFVLAELTNEAREPALSVKNKQTFNTLIAETFISELPDDFDNFPKFY